MSGHYLWSKDGGSEPDGEMMAYLAADDVVLDRLLLPYDFEASAAHAAGLARIGILSTEEAAAVERALSELLAECRAGRFTCAPPHEDGHSAIEQALVERLGALGRKIHTGRSRNDQVLVALRLYLKDRLGDLAAVCLDVADAALDRAAADPATPLPGYTHMQRAVPSSLGLWLASYGEAFVDNGEVALAVRAHLDRSPLGSAAGYGVNLPLDRAGVAAELGFAGVIHNPLYAQTGRGKFELLAVQALGQATLDLRRLAWDLSLYTTAEFGFVTLPPAWTTGSSLMPNKANPDIVEMLRACHATVQAAAGEIENLLALPGGYHRDLQNTKAPLLRAFGRGLPALSLTARLLAALEFERAAMQEAITPEMLATDRAIDQARSGTPFRDAYRKAAGRLPGTAAAAGVAASLAARVSPGACGALDLDGLRRRAADLRRRLPAA